MARELVKYKNDMNKLSFKGFSKNDMNLFMSICSKVKEKESNEIILDFDSLRTISGYTATAIDNFIKDLRKMSRDVMSVNCEIITENKIDMFNLFSRFTIDKDTQTLTVRINSEFTWLLNEFTDKMKGYTTFELYEFVGLQSRYTKNLYRILKQWRTNGEFTFNSIDDFKLKLDVPESYTNKKITQKVIKPAVTEMQELDKSFKNFKCEPLYLHKRGKPLAGYKFTWEPEGRANKQDLSQKQSKSGSVKNQKTQNGFNNFHQHGYNFNNLETQLLQKLNKSENDEDMEDFLKKI